MALSIKTEEADRLARELARRTGRTMTEAVTLALRNELDRTPPRLQPKAPGKGDPGWAEYVIGKTRELMGPGPFAPYTKAEADEFCDSGIDIHLSPKRP